MIKKILLIITLFHNFQIIAMQEASLDAQMEIIGKLLEAVKVSKSNSLEKNIESLMNERAHLIATSKSFKKFIEEQRKIPILKKIKDELLRVYTPIELAKAWQLFYEDKIIEKNKVVKKYEDLAAVLLFANAKILNAFNGAVNIKLPIVQNITNLFRLAYGLSKTCEQMKKVFSEFHTLECPKKIDYFKAMANELKSKYKKDTLERIWIAYANSPEVLSLLILSDVEIDTQHLILIAALGNYANTIDFLKQRNISINTPDNEGKTVLIHLIADDTYWTYDLSQPGIKKKFNTIDSVTRKKAIEFLLKQGANVNIKDQNHKTALDYANEKKLYDIASILTSKGAKIGAEIK
ncbi:ankyrin repeat domain-containing protein [Candidatus Dependentiae bacterium]|nr:ankyrin repeat domain-containing protein [Candidatus Dependentiae bacterium]